MSSEASFFPSEVTTVPAHFSNEIKAAVEAALLAGKVLKEGFGSEYLISPKTLKNDVVTEFDHRSEKLLKDFMMERFPRYSLLCEESDEIRYEDSELTWIIDPLDGTINFAHNIPIFCISIALAKGEEVLCGVIFNPMTQELFIGERGAGVYLNGKKAKVSDTASLDSAFVATSLSFNLHKDPVKSMRYFSEMAYRGFPMRSMGSTALNLAYIAAGCFDAYWSVGDSAYSWDIAAGKLMVEEAGGIVTQCDGRPYSLYQESTLLVSNGLLHQEIRNYFGEKL